MGRKQTRSSLIRCFENWGTLNQPRTLTANALVRGGKVTRDEIQRLKAGQPRLTTDRVFSGPVVEFETFALNAMDETIPPLLRFSALLTS